MPAEDYQFLPVQCCDKCGALHPEQEACVVALRCCDCGGPAGLYAWDPDNTERTCHSCFKERRAA